MVLEGTFKEQLHRIDDNFQKIMGQLVKKEHKILSKINSLIVFRWDIVHRQTN